jgi:hypothetical protein
VQSALDDVLALADTEKETLVAQIHNLQNLLLHLRPSAAATKDRAEREVEDAHLLDGFLPGVRESVGDELFSRTVQAECLQKTLVADALQVRARLRLA